MVKDSVAVRPMKGTVTAETTINYKINKNIFEGNQKYVKNLWKDGKK